MPNKAVFLDRDDTLIEDPGYISSPEQVKLLSGVPKALIELRSMGYKLVVVTNQSAVARGIVTEKVLSEIHDRLKALLAEQNASLDAIYYCPYHPEGAIPRYRRQSDCRKPNPGMLLKAADEMDIDLAQSWVIGNSDSDVEAGLRAGCRTILVEPPWRRRQLEPNRPVPHHKAVNITEAVNIIKKYHRAPDAADDAPRTSGTDQPSEPDQSSTAEQAAPLPEPAYQPNAGAPLDQPQSDGQDQSSPPEVQPQPTDAAAPAEPPTTQEELLAEILEQIKSIQRSSMFEEFSSLRFIAGIVQMLVLLCLIITVWLLLSPQRSGTSVLIALGFAAVLQLMSLTFFVMQSRK